MPSTPALEATCSCGARGVWRDGTFQGPCRCAGAGDMAVGFPTPTEVPERAPRISREAAGPETPFWPTARVTKDQLTLWLPRVARSAEGTNGRSWKTRSAAKRRWEILVGTALSGLAKVPRFERVTISYTQFRRKGTTAQDRENLVSACKPIPDALVRAGVLPDDSPKHVVATPDAHQEVSAMPWGFLVVSVRRVK